MARLRHPRLGDQLNSLGEFIAAQRRAAELTLRQLAEQTGISNPYLSQIERGLRKPSAEVLQQLSKALRVSSETLYVRAGILNPEDHPSTTVEMAVLADTAIRAQDIDEASVRKAKEEAERILANRGEAMEVAEAQQRLAEVSAQLQALERLRKNLKH